jgi:hypothetical protein
MVRGENDKVVIAVDVVVVVVIVVALQWNQPYHV